MNGLDVLAVINTFRIGGHWRSRMELLGGIEGAETRLQDCQNISGEDEEEEELGEATPSTSLILKFYFSDKKLSSVPTGLFSLFV
jgi:hypothetical protein